VLEIGDEGVLGGGRESGERVIVASDCFGVQLGEALGQGRSLSSTGVGEELEDECIGSGCEGAGKFIGGKQPIGERARGWERGGGQR